MAAVIVLNGIDEAISSLNYRNPQTLKCRLVHAIRGFYQDESSVESLQGIDPEDLIKLLWDTGDDPSVIKAKRKNLSSIKSSVNRDLKRLYRDGKNPNGIAIGRNNIFVMFDEAKDNFLATLSATPASVPNLGKIAEVLKVVNEVLSNPEALADAASSGGPTELEDLRSSIRGLLEKLGEEPEQGEEREGLEQSEVEEAVEEVDVEEAVEEADVEEVVDEADLEDVEEPEAAEDLEEVEAEEALEALEESEVGEVLDEAELEDAEELEAAEEVEEVETEGTLDESEVEEAAEEVDVEEAVEEADVEEIVDEADLEDVEEPEAAEDLEEVEAAEALDESEVEEVLDEAALDDVEEVEAAEAPDESDVEEVVEGAEEDQVLENVEVGEDYEEVEIDDALEEMGLPVGSLGGEYSDGAYETHDTIRHKLLAETFDGYLGAMERFYNQYILIPEGEYIVGAKVPKKDERPEHRVRLASFYIGKFPVTNALFEIFVEKTGYKTTAEKLGYGTVYYGRFSETVDEETGLVKLTCHSSVRFKTVYGACWYQPFGPGSTLHNKRNHPVVQVSLEDAMAFAAWTGKRLATENEWEAAARTSDGRVFPWGNERKSNSCNIEESSVADATPVDRYVESANDFGIVDTLGNVLEWTLDSFESPQHTKSNTKYHIAKGGSWISDNGMGLFSRFRVELGSSSNILGFRCVAY